MRRSRLLRKWVQRERQPRVPWGTRTRNRNAARCLQGVAPTFRKTKRTCWPEDKPRKHWSRKWSPVGNAAYRSCRWGERPLWGFVAVEWLMTLMKKQSQRRGRDDSICICYELIDRQTDREWMGGWVDRWLAGCLYGASPHHPQYPRNRSIINIG